MDIIGKLRNIDGGLVRIGFALGTIAALAWMLWPQDLAKLEFDRVWAFVTAAVVWFYAELRMMRPHEEHPHDITLLKKVRELVSEDSLHFLRLHHFGGSFRNDQIEFLGRIYHTWEGIDYEFTDKRVEALFSKFRGCAGKLYRKIMDYTEQNRIREHLRKVTDRDKTGELHYGPIEEYVDELNKSASKLLMLYESFERLARKRLPPVYKETPDRPLVSAED